jgi:uncharacterized protein YbaP (TraB family)
MKKLGAGLLLTLISLVSFSQVTKKEPNTLLWQISGNGLEKPSYLFGTIHMICEKDALLSDSLKEAIRKTDAVYMEVDMNNIFEMFTVMTKMKMLNDTTLSDLLSKKDYGTLKNYFETKNEILPFSVLETYKPLLIASMLQESGSSCESVSAMEMVIMKEAEYYKKSIKGLETIAYQMGIFDSIPYKVQAEELVKYVEQIKKGNDNKEFEKLIEAYKNQDLTKLEELIKNTDIGIANYTDILLYNRNRNWVEKLKIILLPNKSFVIAVGAGHLPGEKGVINLLRKAGYTVKPVPNKIRRTTQI